MTEAKATTKSDLLEGWVLLIGAPLVLIAWIVAQLYGVFGWLMLGLAIWFGITIGAALAADRWRIPSAIMLLAGPAVAIATLFVFRAAIHPHFSWSNAWGFLCWIGESSAC